MILVWGLGFEEVGRGMLMLIVLKVLEYSSWLLELITKVFEIIVILNRRYIISVALKLKESFIYFY